MLNGKLTELKNTTLEELVARIAVDYYDSIEAMCDTARKQALKLKELEMQQSTSHYVNLCVRLTDDVSRYIKSRRESFVPYVLALHHKTVDGHDCTSCSGGCDMQHELKLAELKTSHAQTKDVISRLQMVSLPLYSETMYPDAYRVLRNQMALIENSITELFFIEEACLVPKVKEAQNNINARI